VDQHNRLVRDTALTLARQLAAECCPGPRPAGSSTWWAGFDVRRAAGLIADRIAGLIATVVAEAVRVEREECALIAEMMEPPGVETISDLIRSRAATG